MDFPNHGPEACLAASIKHTPKCEEVANRQMKWRPYIGLSTHHQEHEAAALQARRHFNPYRDESIPRSVRLAQDMAMEKCCHDSVRSASSIADSSSNVGSCYTLASSKASRTSKASSVPNLDRIPTGDSRRIQNPGGIAARRKECTFKSPGIWPADAEWYKEMLLREGPAGMVGGNVPSCMMGDGLVAYGDREILSAGVLGLEPRSLLKAK